MSLFIKLFNTTAEYEEARQNLILPNVSVAKDDLTTVHYNPIISIANAVITCDSATYNGQTQVATNIVVTLNGETLISGTDYTVSNNDGGINTGNYTFTVNGIGNYGGSKNGTFTINKVTPTVTVPTAISSIVYNADAQALVNAGSTDYGTLQYSLDDSNYSTTIPSGTNAGSYTIYYKVVGDSNINDVASASINNSISKATPTVVIPVAKVLTYNGSAQELVNAGSTDWGTLQYRAGSDSWSTSIPTRTRGGSYTVEYKVVGDSNINDVATQSVQCSINEKPVTATVTLSQTTYTYDNTAKTPTPTVKDGSTVIDPSEYSVIYSNNVNAGTGTVTISDNVGGDYEVIGSATFTINKVTPTVTAPTAKSLTYTGSAQALVNAGSTNYGTLKYSTDGSTYSTGIPSGTNATSYTVYYKVDGDSNINSVAAQSIAVTIAKANQTAPTATGATTTYNTTATATASGGGGQGSLEWYNGNTQTSVGSKATKARWSGNSNYNASPYSNEVTLTMNKANQSAPTATGATVNYGSTATATASGGGGQGSLEWSNGNTRTAVGSQTTSARWSGNGNYNASSWSNSVTLTVHDYSKDYLTFVSLSNNNTIGWKAGRNNNQPYLSKTIYYSTDKTNWTSASSTSGGTTLATLNTGDKLYIKGTNNNYGSFYQGFTYCHFTSTNQFTAEGNIMSLIGGDNFTDLTAFTSSNYSVFCYLFYECTGLTSVENMSLPAKTLIDRCYLCMFRNCTSLTTVPKLPATTLAFYCYHSMFYGCTSLTTVPSNMLPATTLDGGCYQTMFKGCTSLTTAPILSAGTLIYDCYYNMFSGCTSLNSITCLATNISASRCTQDWVSNVAASGTFTKAASMTSWTTGTSGIPSNWTVVNASS